MALQCIRFLLPESGDVLRDADRNGRFARCLSQSDQSAAEAGWRAQLLRQFRVTPRGVPVAAVTRQQDCGDALGSTWLRADPAFVQVDMHTGRLMACGDLGLSMANCDALLKPLKPLFGDEGLPISAGSSGRWYLQLPRNAELPVFTDPQDALGADLADCLPAGAPGVRWRRLFNEAQMILHQHPVNLQRRESGMAPVNALWFWGSGQWPDQVSCDTTLLLSDCPLLIALAAMADCPVQSPAQVDELTSQPSTASRWAMDLRDRRDAQRIVDAMLERLSDGLRPTFVEMDFADGCIAHWKRWHRLRIWRRP